MAGFFFVQVVFVRGGFCPYTGHLPIPLMEIWSFAPPFWKLWSCTRTRVQCTQILRVHYEYI